MTIAFRYFKIILIPVFKTLLKIGSTSRSVASEKKGDEEYKLGTTISFKNNQVKIEANFLVYPTTTQEKVKDFLKDITVQTYKRREQEIWEINNNKKSMSEEVIPEKEEVITNTIYQK